MTTPRRFVLVVSLQPLDAPTALFFGHLLRLAPDMIRIVRYGKGDMARLIGAASAVIFVRGLFEFGDLPTCAWSLGIPLYYFIDDNFIVLREHGGTDARFVERYSLDNVRSALQSFTGVLVATRPLMSYFSERRLHSHLMLYPPVQAEREPDVHEQAAGVRVAFFGGRHLHALFLGVVMPAIRRLAQQRPVILLATGVPQVIEPSDGLSVIQHPYDESYSRGIARLRQLGVDVFVHPVAAGVANNAYKNPHALISACALNAVPVVSDAPPYGNLRSENVALYCTDTEDSWYNALASAASDEGLRSSLQARLTEYCANQFGGAANRAVLEQMLSEHGSPTPGRIALRRGVVSGCVLLDRVRRAVSRLAGGGLRIPVAP